MQQILEVQSTSLVPNFEFEQSYEGPDACLSVTGKFPFE